MGRAETKTKKERGGMKRDDSRSRRKCHVNSSSSEKTLKENDVCFNGAKNLWSLKDGS